MHYLLCRPLFDGKGGVILDSELHKEGFVRFMDPDSGIPLCFCLSLGINLIFLLLFSSHLLFFTYFYVNFLFCIHTQHRFISSPKSGTYLVKSLKFSTFNMNSMYSKKAYIFLLICVVKEPMYWKDETVLVHTENPNNSHIIISFHFCVHLDL